MYGSDHPCRSAHKLGIINYLHPESKWQATSVLRSPDLNEAICHDHHKTPTVEEVAHEFTHSHHGYWSIVLDQESSLPTTFNSPFGRYHFLHLPFGLVCSQDNFQTKMDQILEECQGCNGITDDITVHGHSKAECDAHLQNLMHVAHKYGLVFNSQKTHVKAPAVNFFGYLYDADGVHPDPDKVNAIHALPVPTNVTKLQEFLGMVTYLNSFIPGLSTLTAPLHKLLKTQTSPGMPLMRLPSSMSRMHFPLPSKLMPHR